MMMAWLRSVVSTSRPVRRHMLIAVAAVAWTLLSGGFEGTAFAGEADLLIPDLKEATFFGGSISGHNLLLYGSLVIAGTLGIALFLGIDRKLKNAELHVSVGVELFGVLRLRPS